MALKSKDTLKGFFKTGMRPREEHYEHVFDSFLHKEDVDHHNNLRINSQEDDAILYLGNGSARLDYIAGTGISLKAGSTLSGGGLFIEENTGNIGIGTNSPNSPLEIRIPNTTGQIGKWTLKQTDGNIRLSNFLGKGVDDIEGAWIGTESYHELHLFTNTESPKLSLSERGIRVNMGHNPFPDRDEIMGMGRIDNAFLSLYSVNGGPLNSRARFGAVNTNNVQETQIQFENMFRMFDYGPADKYSELRFVIDEKGYVGIGEADPEGQLHVSNGPAAGSGWERGIVLNYSSMIVFKTDQGHAFGIGTDNLGNLYFRVANSIDGFGSATTAFYIDNIGKIHWGPHNRQ